MRIFSTDQNNVPVIFDTGANLTITHSIDDFIKFPQPLHMPLFLGGMADGFEVSVIAEISWTFEACEHKEVQIIT